MQTCNNIKSLYIFKSLKAKCKIYFLQLCNIFLNTSFVFIICLQFNASLNNGINRNKIVATNVSLHCCVQRGIVVSNLE